MTDRQTQVIELRDEIEKLKEQIDTMQDDNNRMYSKMTSREDERDEARRRMRSACTARPVLVARRQALLDSAPVHDIGSPVWTEFFELGRLLGDA